MTCYATDLMAWAYAHEALASGLSALVAAIFTIAVLVWSTKKSDRHNNERRRKKFESARAVMPLALSRLVDYAERALTYSLIGKKNITKHGTHADAFPQLPDDVVPILREVIEYADEDEVGHALRELISEVQVHDSRMHSLPGGEVVVEPTGVPRIKLPRRYDQAIWDAVHLSLHAAAFFDYARFRTDALPEKPTDDDVRNRMIFLSISIPDAYAKDDSN